MTLQKGQILNNRYRIVKLLGQGGFGAVYRAWNMNMEAPCAVKENFDTSPEAVRQFKSEATILYKLRHPNLPIVTDHFVIPGQGQYLVMDYIEGEDLQEKIDLAGGPLPESQVIPWIEQVCDALEYLHNQTPPVIHRDIKPANIKITPGGVAMLVDFGIAKIYDPHLATTMGARAITPGYSPPEQYGQGSTDARSDIYALGATTYTLLTNTIPPDSVDVMTKSKAPPAAVGALNQQVSPSVSQAIATAMELDRDLRFQRAQEFKVALKPKHPVTTSTPAPHIATVKVPEVPPKEMGIKGTIFNYIFFSSISAIVGGGILFYWILIVLNSGNVETPVFLGIWAGFGIVESLVFSIFYSSFYRWIKNGNQELADQNESVIAFGLASYKRLGILYYLGALYLTEREILFLSWPIFQPRMDKRLDLSTIDTISRYKVYGIFPSGLSIKVGDGHYEKFHVKLIKEWKKEIEAVRTNLSP